jgi:hypothetical protein
MVVAERLVIVPVVEFNVGIVAIPEITKSVPAIPPFTWRVSVGRDVPIPTLLLVVLARIRSVPTSNPFFTTKFLFTAMLFRVHSPPIFYYL